MEFFVDSIQNRKRELNICMHDIQRILHEGASSKFLDIKEGELQQVIEVVLRQEEVVWFQKS